MSILYCLIHSGTQALSAGSNPAGGHGGILIPIPAELGKSEEEEIRSHLSEKLGLSSITLQPYKAEFPGGMKLRLVHCDIPGISESEGRRWVDLQETQPLSAQELRAVQFLIEKNTLSGQGGLWSEAVKARYYQEKGSRYTPQYLSRLEARGRIRQRDQESAPAERLLVLAFAALLGISFDYFFNGQRFGISVPIFALLFLGAAHLTFKGMKQVFLSSFLLGASLMLCLTYALFNNETLRFLNGLAIPLALTGYVLSARYGTWKSLDFSALGALISKLVPQSLESAPKLITFLLQTAKTKPSDQASEIRNQILRGLLLAAPLLVVVMLLLTRSDAVFSRLITDRFTFLDLDMDRVISHGLVSVIGGFYFFGYLWSLKYESPSDSASPLGKKNLEAVTALTVMGLLSGVYLLFTLVQFTYLYSGSASLPNGLTYAVYARRGFFELVAAASLNMAVILAVASKVREHQPQMMKALKVCNSLMTAFTLNLLVSAFYRMHLYEAAYGFTELRLFVQFFMAAMAISLMALMIWIWKQKFPLFKVVLITAITVYLALNYVNVDRLIAHNNLERYQLTKQVDIYTLSWLSVDAWPEIAQAALDPSTKDSLRETFLMNQYPFEDAHDQWFEYNLNVSRFLALEPKQPPVMRERYY